MVQYHRFLLHHQVPLAAALKQVNEEPFLDLSLPLPKDWLLPPNQLQPQTQRPAASSSSKARAGAGEEGEHKGSTALTLGAADCAADPPFEPSGTLGSTYFPHMVMRLKRKSDQQGVDCCHDTAASHDAAQATLRSEERHGDQLSPRSSSRLAAARSVPREPALAAVEPSGRASGLPTHISFASQSLGQRACPTNLPSSSGDVGPVIGPDPKPDDFHTALDSLRIAEQPGFSIASRGSGDHRVLDGFLAGAPDPVALVGARIKARRLRGPSSALTQLLAATTVPPSSQGDASASSDCGIASSLAGMGPSTSGVSGAQDGHRVQGGCMRTARTDIPHLRECLAEFLLEEVIEWACPRGSGQRSMAGTSLSSSHPIRKQVDLSAECTQIHRLY